jgi:subtilase family serine protease
MKMPMVRTTFASLLTIATATTALASPADAANQLSGHIARPVFHVRRAATASPTGLSPAQVKAVYNLPADGGSGTIAIIDAYNDPSIEKDLGVFSTKFGLPACTTTNGCFKKHQMSSFTSNNSGWALEMSLDVEWAHAIAPQAKILLVEARSSQLGDLLNAVDYARGRSEVTAISMSWGAGEFSSEANYDSHFSSTTGATFFASSGDGGHGVSWPAVAAGVVGVGGTTLSFNPDGSLSNETAWNGSGGGLSAYENEPAFQTSFGIPSDPTAKRAVPDVSYDADPASGFSVYDSTRYQRQSGWFQVGGTSAGAPQWAAIKALGQTATAASIYADGAASNHASYLRDVAAGTNGACATYCLTAPGYDYVTGLGSPLTTAF